MTKEPLTFLIPDTPVDPAVYSNRCDRPQDEQNAKAAMKSGFEAIRDAVAARLEADVDRRMKETEPTVDVGPDYGIDVSALLGSVEAPPRAEVEAMLRRVTGDDSIEVLSAEIIGTDLRVALVSPPLETIEFTIAVPGFMPGDHINHDEGNPDQ